MVAFGPSVLCRDAEPYYYDYLCGLEAEIPQAVVDHIRRCPDCRAQIRQLGAALSESEVRDHRPESDADVVGALSLHFAHLGQDITCATVKSFLPVLLIPSLQIRIPTPVTVHVDHCRQCSEDLEALRELELRPDQLARLSRLYAATPDGEPRMCRRARAKTWAFACASFEGIDAESLDHMCVCPRCRHRVYRRREKILAGRQPGDTIPGVGLCSGISMADLFEWVVPYGRAGDDPGRTAGEEMPSHLQACPECIEKMQVLHRTIYGIAERVDSGVSTVYTTGSEVKGNAGAAESLYCGYPIHVAVAQHDPQPAVIRFQPIMRVREVLERGAANPRFRQVMKAALPAAAMISLAILLIVNIQPASAVNTRQLSNAVQSIRNVHITQHQYADDGRESVMQLLIERDLGLVVVRDPQKDIRYDLKGHEIMVRRLSGGTIERTPLEPDEQARLEQRVDDVLGLAMTGAPADAELQAVASDAPEGVAPDSLAYELEWPGDLSDGRVLRYRLKTYLDPTTRLPSRTELWRLTRDDARWSVRSAREFAYPRRQAMDRAIEDVFPSGQNQSGDHRGL